MPKRNYDSKMPYSKDLKPGGKSSSKILTLRNMIIAATTVGLIWFHVIASNAAEAKGAGGGGTIAVIDAGSSGSRIHVYKYKNDGSGSKIVEADHQTLKSKPGLSSFANENPDDAGSSLEPLLEFAKKHISTDTISSTPILLKATAGLRLVQQENPQAVDTILQSVQKTLKDSGFQFTTSDAQIISGQEEGMLGWLALNYLYDTAKKSNLRSSNKPIWSVFEMGGASVQVSVPLDDNDSQGIPSEQILPYSSPTSGEKGSMYTHSFLGFGVQSARSAVDKALLTPNEEGGTKLDHPCLPTGYTETAPSDDHTITGTGNFEGCQEIIRSAVFTPQENEIAECKKAGANHCFWNGVAGPKLSDSDSNKVWAFENFFYTMSGVGEMEADESAREFVIADYLRVAKVMCTKSWSETEENYPKDAQPRSYNSEWCFSALYAYSILTLGLGLDPQQTIMIGNKVDNFGIDWALGAVLQHQ